MDQWLDSLSEDWISQPRSPHSSSLAKGSPSPITSTTSQSRIPRYKPRSTSNLSTTSRSESENPNPARRSSLNEAALKEKTSSNINASNKRLPNGETKPQSLNAASMRLHKRHTSAGSTHPGPLGTVQHKSSPVKEKKAQVTPEWKRRVLKENAGGDLFSPIGLESVFKPPKAKANTGVKSTRKNKLLPQANVPSSPPPLPSIAPDKLNAPITNFPETTAAPLSTSAPCAGKTISRMGPVREEAPFQNEKPAEDLDYRNEENPANLDGVEDSLIPSLVRSPLVPSTQLYCLSPASGRPSPIPAYDSRENTKNCTAHDDKSGNEDFTPYFVSRHDTVDGRIEYAAVDRSMQRLRSKMDKLRSQQQNIPSSRSSDHEIDYAELRPFERSPLDGQLDELTSQSLPDDLSMGTDAFVANGGFVSIHRGGYSNDGSFQRRPLSPSLLPDLDRPSSKSRLLISRNAIETPQSPENFSQTKSKTPSSPPQTPKNNDFEHTDSHERPQSSGSPLKLFDKYDTFTNDKLARRITKFEQTLDQELDATSMQEPSSPSPRRRRPYKSSQEKLSHESPRTRRISSFGDGQLNGHDFLLHRPSDLNLSLDQVERNFDRQLPSRQRSSEIRTRLTSSCSFNASEHQQLIRRLNGRTAISGGSPGQNPEIQNIIGRVDQKSINRHGTSLIHEEQEMSGATPGKRLPHSPFRDPVPKRRRTLQAPSDLKQRSMTSQHVEVKATPIEHVHGRKRKDALYNNDRQVADPSVIATRQILQPRLPGPAQTGSSTKLRACGIIDEVLIAEAGTHSNNQKFTERHECAMDPPTQIVAGALATVALTTAQDITYGSRKTSVATADFFNEAQQIMQFIRAKGRPRSSHTTADASVVEHSTILEELNLENSTRDEFSRPPSREGSEPSRQREPIRTDARVLSQLRKYEDEDDMDLALTSSLKVLQIHQSCKESGPLANRSFENEYNHPSTESDPPNIRISEGTGRLWEDENGSHAGTQTRPRTQDSQSNSGPSSSRSDPTGSSQGSTKRMVIAPETVAHLLSDQMAGMVFDRQKQLWVKRKSSPNAGGIQDLDRSASEETDEDLFCDIPDLTVDEMNELRTVKDAVASEKMLGTAIDTISTGNQLVSAEEQNRAFGSHEVVEGTRPRTADGKSIEPVETSSAPSKYSHFASSGPIPGTRATSWGDEPRFTKEAQPPKQPPSKSLTVPNNNPAEEVEHEISILDGRESRNSRRQNKRHQARVVTVAFSSPLVDQRELSYDQDDRSQVQDGRNELSLNESSVIRASHRKSSSRRRTSFGPISKSSQRKPCRRLSIDKQSYNARPMSRLDERDEMSLVHFATSDSQMTMEVAISTPLPLSRSLLLQPPTAGHRTSTGLNLSPLSEFTLHQVDKPIDPSIGYLTRHHDVREQGADNKLSLAAENLVKKLTDFEPFEPYWDFIRSVDLHGRELKTLHMLEDFCGRVEELDVSNNQIRGLDGIPHTVRLLNIRGNLLSDLSAWHHLQNLQYLDASSNRLRSLEGFQYLLHLRALKAENNEVETLGGLEDLDGLTSLSLRGNKLRSVDFNKSNLVRLMHMDLRENELTTVSNVYRLTALETCDLSHNALATLDFSVSIPLFRMRTLNVSNNYLSSLDLAELPNLRTLNLDNNSIASVESLSHLKTLETLSWREQTLDSAYGYSEIQYRHCHEIRNLFFSGNRLSTFAPSSPFLNLHHLELASTGLQALSSDFGMKCPNLRVLNVNYNAIRDLQPLLGIVKLQKLFLAGNRLSRLRRTITLLQRFGKTLVEIDLRDNPLTVGFYTPQQSAKENPCVALSKHNNHIDGDGSESEAERIQAFRLPALNNEMDNILRERLDEDTKLRRRVHELLIVHSCPLLKRLDGLNVAMKVVKKRDGVWERLAELGVINTTAMREREGCNG